MRRPFAWSPRLVTALVAAVYVVAGKFGLTLAFVNASASAVWPPTGIALAALLLFGYNVWPGILVGAFLVNVTTAGSFLTSLGIALGNTLEAGAGAWLVDRFAGGRRVFRQVPDVFRFIVLAGLLGTTISPTIGVTSLALGGFAPWSRYGTIWWTWWLGDMVGAFIVTPLLLLWATERPRWTLAQTAEFIVALLAVCLMGQVVFGGVLPTPMRNYPLEFLCIPPLVWVAFRFSPREASAAVVVLASLAISGTLRGFGPFVAATQNAALLLLQAFMGVTALGVLVLATVVAEQKRVEQEKHLLASIVESSDEAIFSKTLEGIITSWNKGAERLYGYTAQEMIGQSVSRLVPSERAEETPRMLKQLRRGERIDHYETERIRKDGRRIMVSLSVSPVRDEQRWIVGASAIALDITERKQAEAVLRQAHDELERRVEERTASLRKSHEELKAAHLRLIQAAKLESVGRLAAGVAHEVKNPLAVILQGVDYLSKRLSTDDGNTTLVLKYTGDAVRRADAVIRGLLDFATTRELVMTEAPLNDVLEKALQLVKHELDRTHVIVTRVFANALPPVRLDRNKIEQVFVNVLMNAIQAMPGGGTLTVKTFEVAGAELAPVLGNGAEALNGTARVVMAEIEDTGCGILEEHLQKVFDPFFTTKPTGQGTGLGLTVTKKIIEMHHGLLVVRNRPEGGVKVMIGFRVGGGEHNGKEAHPTRG